MRLQGDYHFDETGRRITFYIELGCYNWLYFKKIFKSDMPFIGTGMNSDTISTKKLAVYCSQPDIRNIPSPGISEGCDLVYINAELGHFCSFVNAANIKCVVKIQQLLFFFVNLVEN